MLGLTPAQIRSFAGEGFLTPERGSRGEMRFGFHDLIILRTAGELSAARIPQRKVRRVLQRLREQLPEGRSLTGVRIAADGERVVVRDGEAVWNPESGQALFDFDISEIEARAATLAPREIRSDAELDAEGWYDVACDLEITSPEDARSAYERVLELDPDHIDAHVNQQGTDDVGPTYPSTCNSALKPAENLLAFFFFDLASCIQDDHEPPKAPPIK